MGKNEKKMAFYEIGRGKFAMWMQEEFERAQKIANESHSEVTISSIIKISPPESEEDCFGKIGFSIKVNRPQRKSIPYTTEIDNGVIVGDGIDIGDILQETLELPEIDPGFSNVSDRVKNY